MCGIAEFIAVWLRQIYRDISRNLGNLWFLGSSVVLIALYLIIRRSQEKKTNIFGVLAMLALIHLILGGLALWYNNDDTYDLITFICYTVIIGLMVISELRQKKESDTKAGDEVEMADGQGIAPEPEAMDQKESDGRQEDEESSQADEPSRRERRRVSRGRG